MLIKEYFDYYFQGFKTLQINNNIEPDLFEINDNTYLYKKIHELQVEATKARNGYKEYNYKLSYKSVSIKDNTATITLLMDVDYKYGIPISPDETPGMYGIEYQFVLNKVDEKWLINNIKSNYDWYVTYEEEINEEAKLNKGVPKQEVMEQYFKDFYESMKRNDEIYKEKTYHLY